jgi:hypothetical protein
LAKPIDAPATNAHNVIEKIVFRIFLPPNDAMLFKPKLLVGVPKHRPGDRLASCRLAAAINHFFVEIRERAAFENV